MLRVLVALYLLQSAKTGTDFQSLAERAAAARDSGRLDEALDLYAKALKLRSEWDEGLWNAGSIAYDKDRFGECAPLFVRLTVLKPALAPAWTMSGLCEFGLKNYAGALKSLLMVEQLQYEGPAELARAARLHLAIVLTKSGNFEKAIVTLTELTRIDRKTPDISIAAGIAGLRKPWVPSEVPETERERVAKLGDAMSTAMELDANAAVAKFESVVKDFPTDPDIHYRFGAFLMGQSPERGLKELKKTLELEPGHIPALIGLASIYLRNGETATALGYARKATEADIGNFAAHVVYGRALLDTDDCIGAAVELETAVKLAPESADAHFSLASAYSRLGRKEDARHEQEEFRRLRKIIDGAHP